jgi:hypothetical protein
MRAVSFAYISTRRGGRAWARRSHTYWITRGDESALRHTRRHATSCGCCWYEGSLKLLAVETIRIWEGQYACRGDLRPIWCWRLWSNQGKPRRSACCRQNFYWLSTRRVSCSAVLCLGRNPNCSSCTSLRSFISLRTLASRIISKTLPTSGEAWGVRFCKHF